MAPRALRRFLCIRPRRVMSHAIVDGDPIFDAFDQSIIAFHYRDYVQDDDLFPQINYTVEIGTSPGKRDVGIFRMRNPINEEGRIDVNETPFGEIPLADGMFVTIVYERRIWEKKLYRLPVGDVDFIERQDYDDAYGGENQLFYPPIVNITRDTLSIEHEYIPMGFLDEGQDYRTLDFTVFFSRSLVNPITAIGWYFLGGLEVYTIGSGTEETVQVQLPAGYIEARVSVLTATGIATRYFDIWTFTGLDDPNLITGFEVESDERGEGRDMSFNIVDLRSRDIHEGTKIGYFEIPADGSEFPEGYISQFVGWTTKDSVPSQLYRNRYKITVGGIKTWLNSIMIGAQTIYDPRTPDDPHGTANRYIEMPNNTPDKTVHYFLRINSNALEVMNLHFSDYQPPIEGYTSSDGSLWSVIVAVIERYFGTAACSSIGSLFLKRHFDYLEVVDRELIDPVMTLDKTKWRDDSAPEFTDQKIDPVSKVDFYGSQYDILYDSGGNQVDFSHTYRVNAPGLIGGKGISVESGIPDIFLMTTNAAVLQIRRLGGHHYARLNNRMTDVSIPLKEDLDMIEVAWGRPIFINYLEDNGHNLVLSAALFLVKSIGVQHSNARNKPSKLITWVVDRVTRGYPGIAIDVTQKINIEEYPIPILSAGTRAVGMITRQRDLFFVYDIDTDTPTTVSVDLSGLIPEDILHFVPSPFSSYYLQTGMTIDIFLMTTGGDIYKISDIEGTRTVILLFSAPSGAIGHFIQYERGRENYIVATYKTSGSFAHVVVSLDGSTFTDYAHPEIGFGPGGVNIVVSPHSESIFLGIQNPSPFRGELWVSTDHGVTLVYQAVPTVHPVFSSLHIPFQSGDDSILYTVAFGAILRSNNGVDATITPTLAGHSPSIDWSGLKTCDVDKNIVLLMMVGGTGTVAFYSENQGNTWSAIYLDTPLEDVTNCNIAGDDPDTLFAWGGNYFGWKQSIDAVIKKRGTITGDVINIFGIPNTP